MALQSLGKESKKTEDASLDKWIKILRQNSTRNGHNLISRVLKYIALFEQRQDGPVNLKDCYEVLSDLTSGKPSKEMNLETTYFLNECFSKLAKEVTKGDMENEVKFLEELKFVDVTPNRTYKKKGKDSGEIEWNFDTNVCKIPSKLLQESNKNESTNE